MSHAREQPVYLPQCLYLCKRCGYDLRGLSRLACPECGRAFDPDDRETFDAVRRHGRGPRWAKKAADRSMLTFCVLLQPWLWPLMMIDAVFCLLDRIRPRRAPAAPPPPGSTLHVMVGREGVAQTPLRPMGWVRFGDERHDVICNEQFVAAGRRVVATDVNARGDILIVRPLPAEA